MDAQWTYGRELSEQMRMQPNVSLWLRCITPIGLGAKPSRTSTARARRCMHICRATRSDVGLGCMGAHADAAQHDFMNGEPLPIVVPHIWVHYMRMYNQYRKLNMYKYDGKNTRSINIIQIHGGQRMCIQMRAHIQAYTCAYECMCICICICIWIRICVCL